MESKTHPHKDEKEAERLGDYNNLSTTSCTICSTLLPLISSHTLSTTILTPTSLMSIPNSFTAERRSAGVASLHSARVEVEGMG